MLKTDLTFLSSAFSIICIVNHKNVTEYQKLPPKYFYVTKKKSEFKKDFTTDENMILQYDDYNQLAEAGQQIIALVQAGCKSRRNTANAGK